jgi:alpha-beta hydrolase superfamily lysophospholipase
MRVSPTQLSVIRMVPIAKRIARAGHGKLAVFRVLNSARGWDTKTTPVDDVHWAIEQMRARFSPEMPVCLVGHSLGGRAALLAASDESVRSVAALAPWVYPDDGQIDLTGRRVVIVHGTADLIAKPSNSAAVARALARTAQVSYVRVEGGKHAMLRHHEQFDGLAASFAAATLLGESATDGVLARVLAGDTLIDS